MSRKSLPRVLLTPLFALGLGGGLMAAPSAYVSQWGSLNIDNDTSSTLLRDTQLSNTVWVMPPTGGDVVFENFSPNANLGFCPGVKSLMNTSNAIEQRLNRVLVQIDGLETELRQAEADLNTAKRAVADTINPQIKDILLADEGISELESKVDGLLAQIESCDEQTCHLLMERYRQKNAELREAKRELRQLRQQYRSDWRSYTVAKQQEDAAQEIYDGIGNRIDRHLSSYTDLSNLVMSRYASRAKLEGGNAFATYRTGWSENIAHLEARYPRYDFKAIPTKEARIHANILGAGDQQSYLESLPAVLDYAINGFAYQPWGQTQQGDGGTALPDVLSGNFRMSLLGGCPLSDAGFFDGISGWQPKRTGDGAPIFGVSATYQYPVAYKYEVTASYNLYKFYELIQESGSRGGFFSSKSYSRVMEKRVDRDTFSIDWTVEDPDSSFDAQKRAEITADLKSNLMNRVLVTIAEPVYQGAPVGPGVAGTPPETGSVVLARGLSRTCGFNIYCQAGSWILKGLGSVFGSSRAESTFRTSWDRTASETWSAEYVSYRGGTTGFANRY